MVQFLYFLSCVLLCGVSLVQAQTTIAARTVNTTIFNPNATIAINASVITVAPSNRTTTLLPNVTVVFINATVPSNMTTTAQVLLTTVLSATTPQPIMPPAAQPPDATTVGSAQGNSLASQVLAVNPIILAIVISLIMGALVIAVAWLAAKISRYGASSVAENLLKSFGQAPDVPEKRANKEDSVFNKEWQDLLKAQTKLKDTETALKMRGSSNDSPSYPSDAPSSGPYPNASATFAAAGNTTGSSGGYGSGYPDATPAYGNNALPSGGGGYASGYPNAAPTYGSNAGYPNASATFGNTAGYTNASIPSYGNTASTTGNGYGSNVNVNNNRPGSSAGGADLSRAVSTARKPMAANPLAKNSGTTPRNINAGEPLSQTQPIMKAKLPPAGSAFAIASSLNRPSSSFQQAPSNPYQQPPPPPQQAPYQPPFQQSLSRQQVPAGTIIDDAEIYTPEQQYQQYQQEQAPPQNHNPAFAPTMIDEAEIYGEVPAAPWEAGSLDPEPFRLGNDTDALDELEKLQANLANAFQ